ncbi:MAG: aminoglycoside phosphotransferase family protein [Bryobacterales bacterium]|nr:aminoglycoside phosphotransferase family protein [Bryobacterales bacterium]
MYFVRTGALRLTLKQAGDGRGEKRQTLLREAEWYWLAQNDPRLERLKSLLPRVYSWDPDRSIFVMETIPGKSMAELGREERYHPARARRMGEAMAMVHEECRGLVAAADLGYQFSRMLPSFLSAPRSAHESAHNTSIPRGQREYLAVLRKYPEFEGPLEKLRASWQVETLIHSDWKLGNCLVDEGDAEAAPHIIDWELLRCGDSLWDAATLLQSYWSGWAERPDAGLLADVRIALAAFWGAYAAGRDWDEAEAAVRRERAMLLAGARMLQSVWESTARQEAMRAADVRMLQMSLNILRDAGPATEELFGA